MNIHIFQSNAWPIWLWPVSQDDYWQACIVKAKMFCAKFEQLKMISDHE
jgi:hypothetical protein